MLKPEFIKGVNDRKFTRKVKCIICRQPSDNGKFMCRKCAEEIKVKERGGGDLR
ncbi:hypothetical protein N752_28780 [Desulforamulus aquiferis]|nr:hypothetical protein N752_28780 [Desulforamulus aquiferis]